MNKKDACFLRKLIYNIKSVKIKIKMVSIFTYILHIKLYKMKTNN
jgi:hypothetical protein